MPAPNRPVTHLTSLGLHALAIVWLGIMAGFFSTYSFNVNFATLQMDGPTYAMVQSALNRNVRHSLFFAFFFLPPLLCALAAAAAWRAALPQTRVVPWGLLVIGAVYGCGIIVFTAQVNLPLNQITESWSPSALPDNWSDVRARWNSANLLRAAVSCACFVCATVLLAWRAVRR